MFATYFSPDHWTKGLNRRLWIGHGWTFCISAIRCSPYVKRIIKFQGVLEPRYFTNYKTIQWPAEFVFGVLFSAGSPRLKCHLYVYIYCLFCPEYWFRKYRWQFRCRKCIKIMHQNIETIPILRPSYCRRIQEL